MGTIYYRLKVWINAAKNALEEETPREEGATVVAHNTRIIDMIRPLENSAKGVLIRGLPVYIYRMLYSEPVADLLEAYRRANEIEGDMIGLG